MARRSRDSRRVGKSAVRMRRLHNAWAVGSVKNEDRATVRPEADESGSVLQSRISTNRVCVCWSRCSIVLASHFASESGTTHSSGENRKDSQDGELTHRILLMSDHRA